MTSRRQGARGSRAGQGREAGGELRGAAGVPGAPQFRGRHRIRVHLLVDGAAECGVREEEQIGVQRVSRSKG